MKEILIFGAPRRERKLKKSTAIKRANNKENGPQGMQREAIEDEKTRDYLKRRTIDRGARVKAISFRPLLKCVRASKKTNTSFIAFVHETLCQGIFLFLYCFEGCNTELFCVCTVGVF